MNSSGTDAWGADVADHEDDGLERVGDYRDRAEEGWDPLANNYEAEAEPDPAEAVDEEAQVWAKEMGFPDQLGVLRVWVDDDVLIDRVRLSIHWRNRLGEQTLQQSFGIVFMLINNYHRLQQRRTLDYYDPDREAAEPLSFDALTRLRERSDDVRRRLEALGEGGHTTLQGEETIGVGLNGRVQLKLNLLGQLDGVLFDPRWLPSARIKEISDGVVEAHADARRRFVPAEVVLGERDRLVDELSEIHHETLAMMRRGFY